MANVWVKATTVKVEDDGTSLVDFSPWEGEPHRIWVQTKDIRADGAEPTLRASAELAVDAWENPKSYTPQGRMDALVNLRAALAEPAKPTGDVGRLRAACMDALSYLGDADPDIRIRRDNVLNALYTALAATESLAEEPVEGPVRVGDRVRCEGEVEKFGNLDDGGVLVNFGSGCLTYMIPEEVTIVSRPAPAETCGRCRWFSDKAASLFACRCSEAPSGLRQVGSESRGCSHFQRWPG